MLHPLQHFDVPFYGMQSISHLVPVIVILLLLLQVVIWGMDHPLHLKVVYSQSMLQITQILQCSTEQSIIHPRPAVIEGEVLGSFPTGDRGLSPPLSRD